MFKELADVVSSFKLRVYHDDLRLVFAELPKFNKTEDELEHDLDRWFYFLKSASSLEAVPKSLDADAAIQHAFSIANKAGLSIEQVREVRGSKEI